MALSEKPQWAKDFEQANQKMVEAFRAFAEKQRPQMEQAERNLAEAARKYLESEPYKRMREALERFTPKK